MTDLRQAAQQALEALEGELLKMLDKPEDEQYRVRYAYLLTVITALRKALAQEHAMHDLVRLGQEIEQAEPVAWMSSDRAWMWSDYSKAIAAVANIPTLTLIPLYAAPPQRPWQGLTDEYLEQIDTEEIYGVVGNHMAIAMAVEAMLKEKNG